MDEGVDDKARRLRQQRELVHGSGAPASLVRALSPGGVPPHQARVGWSEMSRAERFTLMGSTALVLGFVSLIGFAAWNAAGAVGVAGVAACVLLCAFAAFVLHRRADRRITQRSDGPTA